MYADFVNMVSLVTFTEKLQLYKVDLKKKSLSSVLGRHENFCCTTTNGHRVFLFYFLGAENI